MRNALCYDSDNTKEQLKELKCPLPWQVPAL